jgi:paired amphipathic helix protein Sin3a
MLERQREIHREEEIIQRERELRERDREQAERYHREQQQHHPVQSHTGSIPIHQPVASKVPNSIHGPNGLLSNLSANTASNPPQGSLQTSNGPGSLFGSQMQHTESAPRSYLQQLQGPSSQPLLGFNGSAPPQVTGGGVALAQSQQPILNVSWFSSPVVFATSEDACLGSHERA